MKSGSSKGKRNVKIFFVRHGESEANLKKEFSNRGYKHGLTARGASQVIILAEALNCLNIHKIYSSPMMRAVETANILAEHLRIPIEITDALREYDCGIIEGRSDSESWDEYDRVFKLWMEGSWHARIEEGESFEDIRSRFLPFIQKIVKRNEKKSSNHPGSWTWWVV
jgi:probable phosphoglycerate mutase